MQRKFVMQTAIAAALAHWLPAYAVDFKLDDGTQIDWNTTISWSDAWRATNADPRLVNPNNGKLQGVVGATGGNTDDGDLNYSEGQQISDLFNASSELRVKHGSFGGALGMRAWYDQALSNDDVNHGSFNNGYTANAPLKDTGFEPFAKFSNVQLMDAYVYNNFDTGAGNLRVTVGRQVLTWGTDLFIQNLNQINAFNLNATHEAGLSASDIILPQGMLAAKMDLADHSSVEAFYQFEFQDNVFPGCGTYFLPVDASVGPNTQNACAGGYFQAKPGTGDAGALASKLYIPATTTVLPSNGGQYGVSGHTSWDDIDFGVYALNLNSRTPFLSAVKGNSPFVGTTPLLGARGVQDELFWEYPEDIHVYGASARAQLGTWTLSTEASITPNQPVQYAVGDLIGGLAYTSSPAILAAILEQQGLPVAAAKKIAALMNANAGPMAGLFADTPLGGVTHGYGRLDKKELSFSVVHGWKDVAAAQSLTVAGEVGMEWANVPDAEDGLRYGRNFVFGVATAPSYNLPAYTSLPGALGKAGAIVTQNGLCPVLNTAGQAGCINGGFVTPFSWGARVRTQLTYPDVFGTGITLKPTFYVADDVKGYSPDGQFNAGRIATTWSLEAAYGKAWGGSVGVTTFNHNAPFDALRDRDYYFAAVKYTF